jgi:deoxyribonuclease-4
MLIGAHMSIAGGVDQAPLRGREVGCEAIQVFTKSSSQWKARPLAKEEIRNFQDNRACTGIGTVVAHASYLINLGSPEPALWERSIEALEIELQRCDRLRISDLILHPGAHMGRGEENGLSRVAAALDRILDHRPVRGARLCLETTAGQGTCLGHRFEHFAMLLRSVGRPRRLGFCIDTCHLLAAGYDFRTPRGYRDVTARFDDQVGLKRVRAFHLNDAKRDLGSRVDRHEHIGRGFIGAEPFGWILRDRRFHGLPMLLETPKGLDGVVMDRKNLALLRRLRDGNRGATPRRSNAKGGAGRARRAGKPA